MRWRKVSKHCGTARSGEEEAHATHLVTRVLCRAESRASEADKGHLVCEVASKLGRGLVECL